VAEGTRATVSWEAGLGGVGLLDLGHLGVEGGGNGLGLLTGLLGSQESGSLALLSGVVESGFSGVDQGVEGGFLSLGLIELSLEWEEVVGGPVGSGIVEGLLGLNAGLGGSGGGKDGSGSSGWDSWVDSSSSNGLIT